MTETERLFANAESDAETRWARTVAAVAADAYERAPVRHGTLRQSISLTEEKTENGYRAVISFSAPHARYVHEGTGRYHPQGRRSRWVYAVSEDGTARFYSTEGQPAKPFLREAAEGAVKRLKEAFE